MINRQLIKWKILPFILVQILWICFHSTGSLALTEDEKNNIAVYKKAGKGVVNITSIVVTWDLFHRLIPREGAGSGAIIDPKGYILTNNHVIKDAQRIEVTLADGSTWPGSLIGTDPENDLAIIRIMAPSERLHVLPLGNSADLQVGQKVLAIGNPFGLHETLTTGIISSMGRSIRSQKGTLIEDLIQTDAAINPGNSGGPLLDSMGKIIGINTAIFSPTGASVGIGFAIPVDTAKRVIPELIEKGYVSHPWIGVSMFPLIPGIARALDLKVERGALIAEVLQGGPADRAGINGSSRMLQVGNVLVPVGGDIIVALNGEKVNSSEDLLRMILKHRPGDKVTLKVLRQKRFLDLPVVLVERPRGK
ncbi:MAG: trypsin-like peptidase domain-containing protein [Deltaproteobacteria bacterium]|nr:trypsin-like peptidase domain-containing protein [Deltaproteobacteria bacterium]